MSIKYNKIKNHRDKNEREEDWKDVKTFLNLDFMVSIASALEFYIIQH